MPFGIIVCPSVWQKIIIVINSLISCLSQAYIYSSHTFIAGDTSLPLFPPSP